MKKNISQYLAALIFIFTLNFSLLEIEAVDPDGPFLVVYDRHRSGMFAVFTSVLGALDMYEKESFSGIRVELDGLYLDPTQGSDWWGQYFEPIHIGDEELAPSIHGFSFEDTHHAIGRGFAIGRERANELINRYVHIKPEIQAEIDQYVMKKFKGRYVIGVHYRGTDKWLESPRVHYEDIAKKVNELIRKHQKQKPWETIKIYLATDQADFISFMNNHFHEKVIYNNFARSNDSTPTHAHNDHLHSSNYQKGKEALFDCLLLSKCDILIRSPDSSLSITSGRFNPTQPQVIMNAPGDNRPGMY